VDTSAVRNMLESKGVHCFSPDQLDLPVQDLAEILRAGMDGADLVIGIVDPTPASNFVFFELGFARALDKRIVVLLVGDVPLSTWLTSGIPYFRFIPEQPASLEFGISQILHIPRHGTRAASRPSKRTQPIGELADHLLAQIRAAGEDLREAEFEDIIARAIRASGVTTVSQGGPHDNHVDLAVWSDDLSPWVGNPVPIDLRLQLGAGELKPVATRLARYLSGSGLLWGLLIYLRADGDVSRAEGVPNVIHLSAEQFLGALRGTSFGDLMRRLRNQRVHGNC
jgi:hypothetical protein